MILRRGAALIAVLACSPLGSALAQASAQALDGAQLFKQQCSVCHTLDASAPTRQGPTLAGVYGRKAGSVPGFKYSPNMAKADWEWDQAKLDTYLTNPQAMVPGGIMAYRQGKPEVRSAIITYLKEQQ